MDATEDQQLEMALAASLREATAASPSTPPAASTPGSGNDAPDSDDEEQSPSSSPFWDSPSAAAVAIDESGIETLALPFRLAIQAAAAALVAAARELLKSRVLKDIPAQWAKIRQGLNIFRIGSKCVCLSNGEV